MRISDWSSDVCSSDLVYTGIIGTSGNVANRQNGTLNLSTFDFISAYYVDFFTDAGAPKLVTASIRTQSPSGHLVSLSAPPAPGLEVRLTSPPTLRTAERRVGKEWVSTCNYRW